MELRWYQEEAVDAIWESISKGNNPCIEAPTGAGKSLMIAGAATQAHDRWGGRSIILAHRKELLQQNAEKIQALCPEIEVGIYSAGLNRRETDSPIVCAGIQSVYRRSAVFGDRDLLFVDEAHGVPPHGDGTYLQFIRNLRASNPHLKVIGFSATPYRTSHGCICDGEVFDEIAYKISVVKLIDEGYLCPLISNAADNHADTSQIQVRGNEFVARSMEDVFIKHELVEAAVSELVAKMADRKSILVFSSGVDHAYAIEEAIQSRVSDHVEVVVGDTPPLLRQQYLESFRNGELRWLINCDVLTTGFDAPCIDGIGVLRATCSPGLFAQMIGRGFRTCPGKLDCLILDFGENVARHGKIDNPHYGRRTKPKAKPGEEGVAPQKACPECDAENLISSRFCWSCGSMFPFDDTPKHQDRAADEEVLGHKKERKEPNTYPVGRVEVCKWIKRKDPEATPTMRVNYIHNDVGNLRSNMTAEWVCIQHAKGSFAHRKAKEWWELHSAAPMPDDVESAVELWRQGALRVPKFIVVDENDKFPRIVNRSFEDEVPEEWNVSDEIFDPFEDVPF